MQVILIRFYYFAYRFGSAKKKLLWTIQIQQKLRDLNLKCMQRYTCVIEHSYYHFIWYFDKKNDQITYVVKSSLEKEKKIYTFFFIMIPQIVSTNVSIILNEESIFYSRLIFGIDPTGIFLQIDLKRVFKNVHFTQNHSSIRKCTAHYFTIDTNPSAVPLCMRIRC